MSGISTPSDFNISQYHRPGPNIGIYARVISEERKAAWVYRVVSVLINLSFLLQIVIGAILTATGLQIHVFFVFRLILEQELLG